MPHQALSQLIRRLETITSLSEDEKNAILALPAKVAELRADADIVREGDDLRNAVCSSKAFSAATKFFPTASARSWRSMCPATSLIS